MPKFLIIVESPAKTKTLKNFLGKDFKVEASMGHVRDLPKKDFGVDIEKGFAPKYVSIADKRNVLSKLKQAAAEAETVYLATDPDREGEAIAWHLRHALKHKNAKRVSFNEITRTAVNEALEHPYEVDENLFNAQQARRVLDRIVGYKLSPLLWKKVKRNLSAGRVQSVSVRLICDREREIQAFVPQEYWSVIAKLAKLDDKKHFSAKLIEKDGQKIELGNESDTNQVLSDLEGAAYAVRDTKESDKKRNPSAPFITSTLQQEASRKLGFSAKKTMMVAQQLYEGIDLGSEGATGLITYMRTDSTRVAGEAIGQAREFIQAQYGKEYLPSSPRQYKSRKSSQDAHEAVRPTSVSLTPEKLEHYMSKDQFRLYKLIWQRFLASQMESAIMRIVTVNISAANYTFRASGSTVKFDGFTVLYTEGKDNVNGKEEDENQTLPLLSKDEMLELLELISKQHFTEPPPRYNEATLVRALEERGIGRPSTYASIISTIQDRDYVVLEDKRFKPTELGCKVTDLLVKHFPDIMDVEFTASVETKLDDIEEGEVDWTKVLSEFWGPFERSLEEAKENMESVKTPPQETDETCPNCGKPLFIRESRFGKFLGCSGYPKCKTIVSKELGEACPVPGCGGEIVEESPGSSKYKCSNHPECTYVSRASAEDENGESEGAETDQKCPKCELPLVRRTGRYGEFLGCSGYPKCRTIVNIPTEVDMKCPKPDCDGNIVQKRTKRGAPFYGCSRYPECEFTSWDKPLPRDCPQCKSMLVDKQWRGRSQGVRCISEECDYKEAASQEEPREEKEKESVAS